MNRRVVIAAAVSAVLLAVLTARYDATAQSPRWSQATAEANARDTARLVGVSSANLRVTATSLLKENLLPYVQRYRPAWVAPFAPLRYAVQAEAPGHRLVFRAEYTPDGKLLRWDCSSCGDRTGATHPPGYFLGVLAGGHSGEFSQHDTGGADGTSRWTWKDAAGSGATMEARITLSHGQLTSAVLDPDISAVKDRHLDDDDFAEAMRNTSIGVTGTALVVAGVLALLRGRKKRPMWRLGLTMACFWIGAFLLGLLLNGYRWPAQEQFLISETGWDGNWWSYHLLQQPLLWWVPCAAGLVLIRGRVVEQWVGFLHAAERWRPARSTGQELLDGLLLGWPLALAPYLVAVAGAPVWDVVSPRIGFEIAPAMAGLLRRTPVSGEVVLYFGFLIPLCTRVIKKQLWRRITLGVVALALFGWIGSNLPARPWLDSVAGIILAAVALWIYRGHGLLGVMAATWGAAMAAPLAWLLTSPLAHSVGLVFSCAVYGGSLAGAAWVRRQGFPGEDEDLIAEIARRNEGGRGSVVRSERELLRAEFAEAREAQMGMLPDKPPVIDGYSIAAVCQPAREVGGDLYDFVELPGGQWGFCVADVSGKGVPAALYMTMTKGVLASEGRVAEDLRQLVLALNEPLHLAGRKKTFVTLVIARLNPQTRMLELIRAGHNPILWRRPARAETVYLQPNGLGLGLVSNKMLGRKLELQEIALEPGDAVLLYSDGLTEAENPRLELFGEDRLKSILERCDAMSADEIVKEVLADVEVFKEGADPHDDLTLMVLKVC